MIRFYAYYNHGGYKDFYLGSQAEETVFKYYLPLLNVHESVLENNYDEELMRCVERQKQLPKLIQLSEQTIESNYPSWARKMMSHSGYKLLYKCLGHHAILAVRDIPGKKDAYGRQTPFNVMMCGDSVEEIENLDSIAEYIRCNMSAFEEKICSFFENDFVENGLKFNHAAFVAYVREMISEKLSLDIDETLKLPIRMLIIPLYATIDNALREQGIAKKELLLCYNVGGVVLYKAKSVPQTSQQPTSEPPRIVGEKTYNGSRVDDATVFHRNDCTDIPSLHAMLNLPKIDDVKKMHEEIADLWRYVRKLENRIEELEKH